MAVTFSNNGDVTGQKIGSRDTGPLDSHSRFQHTVLARLASDILQLSSSSSISLLLSRTLSCRSICSG